VWSVVPVEQCRKRLSLAHPQSSEDGQKTHCTHCIQLRLCLAPPPHAGVSAGSTLIGFGQLTPEGPPVGNTGPFITNGLLPSVGNGYVSTQFTSSVAYIAGMFHGDTFNESTPTPSRAALPSAVSVSVVSHTSCSGRPPPTHTHALTCRNPRTCSCSSQPSNMPRLSRRACVSY